MCEYLKILGISRDNPEIKHICECIKSVCRPDAKKVSGISLKKKLNIYDLHADTQTEHGADFIFCISDIFHKKQKNYQKVNKE